MDRATLTELLDKENVDPRTYSLDSSNPDEQYCMQHMSDGWHVFYAERGLRREESVYDDEHEACSDLLERILRDSTTRRRN